MSAVSSGVSPGSTTTVPSSVGASCSQREPDGVAGAALLVLDDRSAPRAISASASMTASRRWPDHDGDVLRADSGAAAASTCPSRLRPPTACSTLGTC